MVDRGQVIFCLTTPLRLRDGCATAAVDGSQRPPRQIRVVQAEQRFGLGGGICETTGKRKAQASRIGGTRTRA